jgi:pilus assembly protein CpaF
MTTAGEIVDAEVRELIRRRGVDPARDPAAVRRLIDEVLADYGDRALTGVLPMLADPGGVARTLFDSVAGLGPLQRYLEDPEVEEIWVNEPGRVFVARRGRSELTTAILSDGQIRDLVERMLKHSGRRVDLSTPFVDATLPDGSRLHVVIPDITRAHYAVNIRKFLIRAHSLDELVGLGSLTPQAARFLEAAVAAGLNVIASGGTQAGKTTLLNCLAAAIPASERVVSCEEVFELRLGLPDWVAMQTRQPNLEGAGEIPLRRLVTEALRMRPSRIIVGEVRQAECLDLLIALNSGLPGMCSIHANSAREAVTKLCTLPLLAGENVSSSFVVPTVASSVDLVVHTETDAGGHRRVGEIVAVSGRVEGTVIETADVFTTRGRRLVRGDGYPPHADRFTRAGYDLPSLLAQPPSAASSLIAARGHAPPPATKPPPRQPLAAGAAGPAAHRRVVQSPPAGGTREV